MKFNILFKSLFFTFLIIGFAACDDDTPLIEFGIFTVIDDNTVEADGEINSSSLTNFNELIDAYSNINKINIKEISGSSDDEINLKVSKVVHEQNIATHLMDGGVIASGGVDFFLAGTTRTKGSNTQIGVHSWTDGTNEATDFPEGSTEHQPYIDYYVSVGFSQADAEAFYYFTINAATAADLHYMTDAEIDQYGIVKP